MARPVALFVVLALAVSACGGDDDTTTVIQEPTTTTEAEPETPAEPAGPSRAEFVREADAVCERFNELFHSDISTAEANRLYERGLATLREVDVPPSLRLEWQQYLAAVEDQARYEAEGDPANAQRARNRKSQVALGIGLAECGTG